MSNISLNDLNDALINLLEDSKISSDDLKREKESVENKIIERTRELEDEKTKLLASIDALSKAYIMLDTEGNITLTNKNLNKVFDVSIDEWKLSDITHILGRDFDFEKAYKTNLANQKREVYEEISFKNKYLEIRFSPVLEKDTNKKIGVLVIIGDVTDEMVLERSRDEFFSIASHELRTPLTAIRGNASLIKEYFSHRLKDKELIEMIDDIEMSSVRLIGIVNDFLNISRLEQGRIQFKVEEFELSELIKETIDEYKKNSLNSQVKLIFKVSNKVIIKADRDRTKQVIINLIGNGIKFTDSGSVSVTIEKDADEVKTFVTDTGRGIPEGNQGLLFRKFQQAGDSLYTRDTTKGTGLGLYISKLIIEGMGGKIWLQKSEINKGSTFAFSLPLSK